MHSNAPTVILFAIFLVPFWTTPALGLTSKPNIVKAIADELDALILETVDEGSWEADVKRDSLDMPNDYSCQVSRVAHRTYKYVCEFTFSIEPYEGEDLGGPWESTCFDVVYIVKVLRAGTPRLTADDDTLQACLESLNEGP